MTAELTAEEVVTRLLASNQIIQSQSEKLYTNRSDMDLSDYLANPIEEDLEEHETLLEKKDKKQKKSNKPKPISKYSFIKGRWKI